MYHAHVRYVQLDEKDYERLGEDRKKAASTANQ